jgi:hypothetical protein
VNNDNYQLKATANAGFDPAEIMKSGARMSLNLAVRPAVTWPEVVELPWNYARTLTHYICPMMLLPVLTQFLGESLALGDFTVPLFKVFFRYFALIVGCVIASLIGERLARMLRSPIDNTQALKLIGFSYSAYFLASPLFLIPSVFAIALARILSFFACLFVLYEGTNYLCNFDKVNQLTFLAIMSLFLIGSDMLVAALM